MNQLPTADLSMA